MKRDHDQSPRPPRVAEPVQVYLRADERARLARLTKELDTTKSDVLRRGLEALELQMTDPAQHPALCVIGIVATSSAGGGGGLDDARDHDRVLADSEEASWHAAEAEDT